MQILVGRWPLHDIAELLVTCGKDHYSRKFKTEYSNIQALTLRMLKSPRHNTLRQCLRGMLRFLEAFPIANHALYMNFKMFVLLVLAMLTGGWCQFVTIKTQTILNVLRGGLVSNHQASLKYFYFHFYSLSLTTLAAFWGH